MKKEFVPYPLALRLKSLGFNEPCFGYYAIGTNNPCLGNAPYYGEGSAPIFSQAFRWFIENYNLYCGFVEPKTMKIRFSHNTYEIIKKESDSEAEIACLEKLLEVVSEFNHQKHE